MLRLNLFRIKTGPEGTYGVLSTPKGQWFNTGELPWSDNKDDVSSIPHGIYTFKFMKSEKFPDGTFEALEVPGRTGVRIHRGNWCGDVSQGFSSDVLGCILLGKVYGQSKNKVGLMQHGVFESTVALQEFQAEMGSDESAEPFELEIVEHYIS